MALIENKIMCFFRSRFVRRDFSSKFEIHILLSLQAGVVQNEN